MKTDKEGGAMKIEAGMRVRLATWEDQSRYITVSAVGKRNFLGVEIDDREYTWASDSDWLPYSPPRKVVRMAPAIVKNSGGRWCITKAVYSSLEDARHEIMGTLSPPLDIKWPASESMWVEVEEEA